MGFLSDLGLDSVEADPNAIPDGKYAGFVFDAKIQAYKDTAKGNALILTYKIAEEGKNFGKTLDEWHSVNSFDTEQKKSYLKRRILSLGVPESKIGDLDVKDLIGTPVYFTKKQNGDFQNVSFVEIRTGDVGAMPTESSAPVGVPAGTDVSDLL